MTGLAAKASDSVHVPANIAEALVNPKAYADRRLHDAYTWLRANNPVGLAEPDGFDRGRDAADRRTSVSYAIRHARRGRKCPAIGGQAGLAREKPGQIQGHIRYRVKSRDQRPRQC